MLNNNNHKLSKNNYNIIIRKHLVIILLHLIHTVIIINNKQDYNNIKYNGKSVYFDEEISYHNNNKYLDRYNINNLNNNKLNI